MAVDPPVVHAVHTLDKLYVSTGLYAIFETRDVFHFIMDGCGVAGVVKFVRHTVTVIRKRL